jgi:hypothetical protein
MSRWFIAKLVLTAAAIAIIVRAFSGASLSRLYPSDYPALAAAIGCILLMLAVNAVRWRTILFYAGATIPLRTALRLVLIGHFFNQTLPSSVGGDAVRAWHVWRGGVPAATALAGVLADRASGVLALTLLSLLTLALSPAVGDARVLALIGLVLGVGIVGFAGVAALSVMPETLLVRLRLALVGRASRLLLRALFSSRGAAAILFASLIMALLNCVSVAMIARGLAVPFSPGAAFLAVPIALLAGAVPVTIGGWGVREGAMVVMLGFYGIDSVAALSISVLLGMLTILCGVPGGLLWLAGGREKPGSLAPAVAGER